ncbi:MAG: hypothetical protein JO257_25405 [Deltaproteobacteria bacterium]|nr:hypothetical protein [Deltaproteobacteria bacterium]
MRLACMALVLAITRPAFADPATADKLAAQANALASQGNFVASAATFRDAYLQDPRPQLICNVGVAFYKANDLPRAAFYLDQCRAVGGQLDAAFLDNVDKVLAAVRQVLTAGDFTPVTLVIDPRMAAATIESSPFDEPIIGQHSVWLPFGTYRVHVHQDGYIDRDEPLHITDRTPITVHVQLEKVVIKPVEPVKAVPSPPPPPPPAHASRVPAIAATAGTVVLGIAGGLLYLHALDLNDQAGATHDYPTYKSLRASTLDYKHLSWVAGGLAGVGAVASGLLWYRSMHVEVAPDHAVAMISGTF